MLGLSDQQKPQYSLFNNQIEYRTVVMGDINAGKTSFLKKMHKNQFLQTNSTLGVQFLNYKMIMPKYQQKFNVRIWDTSGDPKFRNLFTSYVKGAQGIFIFINIQQLCPFLSKQLETHHVRIGKQSKFIEQLSKQIKPFIIFIQNNRDSKVPLVYYFLISKIDLIESDEQRKQIFEKISQTANQLLNEWDHSQESKLKKQSQCQTYQCTKFYEMISSKEQPAEQLKKIIRRMIQMIYLERQQDYDEMMTALEDLKLKKTQTYGDALQQKYSAYRSSLSMHQQNLSSSKKTFSSKNKKSKASSQIKQSSIILDDGKKKNKKKKEKCC